MVYYVTGYRKKVVMQNLKQAFPEKSEEEIKTIAKKYFRNLADMVVETIKMTSISQKEINKRFSGDMSILNELEKQGRGYHIHIGHNFNWEWGNLLLKTKVNIPFLVTYMPLSNPAANKLFLKIRSRFGSVMVAANDVQKGMKPWQNKPFANVLVADQNPGMRRRACWYPFLNKMTAFYKGPELSARRGNIPIVYGEIHKVKRGKYNFTLELISNNPTEEKEWAVTGKFAQLLEKGIRQYPDNWVWSHRRWKHEWKGELN